VTISSEAVTGSRRISLVR